MTRHSKLLTANGIKIMPPDEFIKFNFKARRRSANSTEQDADAETFVEDDDDDDVEEDEEEIMDEHSSIDGTIHKLANPALQGSSTATASSATSSSPDTPAANKLLQFCAQVANQMGQVMPTQS